MNDTALRKTGNLSMKNVMKTEIRTEFVLCHRNIQRAWSREHDTRFTLLLPPLIHFDDVHRTRIFPSIAPACKMIFFFLNDHGTRALCTRIVCLYSVVLNFKTHATKVCEGLTLLMVSGHVISPRKTGTSSQTWSRNSRLK